MYGHHVLEKRGAFFDRRQIVTYIESGRSHGPAFPAAVLNDITIQLRAAVSGRTGGSTDCEPRACVRARR
jgi:hypothetical protein